MSFVAISAGVGVASLGISIGKSISQNKKASAIEKANSRPTYQIPEEYKQNLAIANHMAQIGLPQQRYNNQLNAINRNQASGIQALGRSQNPSGSIASIVRAGNDANNNLNAQDAQVKQQNQLGLINQNAAMGNQKLAQQQYNNFDRYTEKFNQAQAYRGAANQNMQNGLNSAASMAGGLASLNGNSNSMGLTAGQVNNTPSLPQAMSGYQPNYLQSKGFGSNFGATPYNPNNPYNQFR